MKQTPPKMTDLSRITIAPSSDIYQNMYCNPAFELENEPEEIRDDFREDFRSVVPPEVNKKSSHGVLSLCISGLRGPWHGWGAVVVSAAFLLLVAALGLALVLILTKLNGQAMEAGLVSPSDPLSGDGVPYSLLPNPINHNASVSTVPTFPEKTPTSPTKCGGILTDPEGTLSSPSHPGPYPPDTLCVWIIRIQPPSLVQLHIFSMSIEGPSPCLFDWLEVREDPEQTSTVTRFCGNAAPPTVNTNSSSVWVTFRSDGSIGGNGFTAQYHSVLQGQKSCTREEFMCDGGRCLLPVSVCDGQPNCQDHSDEANCSHKHKECGGKIAGPSGSLYSPNHPKPYPHQQLCTWTISVQEGDVVRLSFRNFSLETQDVCEFDYVEVHDSANAGGGNVLGRFCGSSLPPDLTSSGPAMTVLFVADEGVADSGFYASYQAISLSDRTCGSAQFTCSSGACLHQDWLCDGWNDCTDGADEQNCGNSTYPPFTSSCEPIQVEMCQGLSYNLTSFPNIWLSIADQREAAAILRQYRVLRELSCFEPLRRLVCGMFVPHCSPLGGVLQPCRSVCSSAEQQCGQTLSLFTLSWPFNCHLLPETQECSLP
ncbi:membrane frizzled-related protein [Denticeps clupeoides]|uniref:membrane frizzled-related protein n=1 Tax=Denticeps clupeoides TaxID=299321 RepID=UPI0010A52051|nr:membrane frizzled-related protein [Denticeps clupeoides]